MSWRTTSASQRITCTTSGMASPTLTGLRRRLLKWYRAYGRDLPWRVTDNPYHTVVSEFMLQQTGVARVLKTWPAFLERFPSMESLANASPADVIRAWSGMGYNRRAINLQRAARAIMEQHGGIVPRDPAVLQTLPGIGRYTAAAIACFAWRRRAAVMDTNIRRVLGRALVGRDDIDADAGWALAEAAVPSDGARASAWHQGLMDLGAMVCTSRRPACGACPLNDVCAAHPLFEDARHATVTYAEIAAALPTLRIAERPRPSQNGWVGTNRYYRGRVIQALRRHTAAAVTLDELGPLVRDGYSATDHEVWLRELLRGLERDGLVTVSSNGQAAGLPE